MLRLWLVVAEVPSPWPRKNAATKTSNGNATNASASGDASLDSISDIGGGGGAFDSSNDGIGDGIGDISSASESTLTPLELSLNAPLQPVTSAHVLLADPAPAAATSCDPGDPAAEPAQPRLPRVHLTELPRPKLSSEHEVTQEVRLESGRHSELDGLIAVLTSYVEGEQTDGKVNAT